MEQGATNSNKKSLDLAKSSLSSYFTPFIKIIFTLLLLGTMSLLIFSNLHTAEYVNVVIKPTYNATKISSQLIVENECVSLLDYDKNDIYKYIANINKLDGINEINGTYSFEYSHKIFTITIPSSIRDFWDSEGYELAIIIAAASLIWPYIKLIILLTVWWYPLNQNKRTKIILFIDQMGKWSYMDLYASVIMTVCFYVHAKFTYNDLFMDIKIVCEPSIGIVTFVIANLLSMAYSHVFIYWDQKYGYPHHVQKFYQSQMNLRVNITPNINEQSIAKQRNNESSSFYNEPDHTFTGSRNRNHLSTPPITERKAYINTNDDDNESNDDSEEILPTYKISGLYSLFAREQIHLWRNNKVYKIFALLYQAQSIWGTICFSFYLFGLYGCLWLIIETIYTCPARFDIDGLAGAIISDNIRTYDPITTANKLITSTDKYNSALFLSACYYFTIIIMPIVTQIVLVLLWTFPMKHKTFVFLLKSLWFVQAWNAFDVFFIGTISGAIEMNLVSSWIIDTQFPELCGEGGILHDIEGGCFIVNGYITRGCWMAGAAAFYQWIAIWFTLRTSQDIGVHGIEY